MGPFEVIILFFFFVYTLALTHLVFSAAKMIPIETCSYFPGGTGSGWLRR